MERPGEANSRNREFLAADRARMAISDILHALLDKENPFDSSGPYNFCVHDLPLRSREETRSEGNRHAILAYTRVSAIYNNENSPCATYFSPIKPGTHNSQLCRFVRQFMSQKHPAPSSVLTADGGILFYVDRLWSSSNYILTTDLHDGASSSVFSHL